MRNLEDMGPGVTRFDNLVRDLVMAGGDRPGEQEMKQSILESLPSEVTAHVMWDATDPNHSYRAFTDHIRRQANGMAYIKSKIRRGGPAALVDVPPEANDYPADIQEEINAVLQRRGFQPRSQRPPQQRREGQQDQAARKPKCANCGSEEHSKDSCPKPVVEFNKRPCHKCGKPGHLARDCRSRPSGNSGPQQQANLVADDNVGFFGGMITFEQDVHYTQYKNEARRFQAPARSRPMPRDIKLADWIRPKFVPVSNRFHALTPHEEPVPDIGTTRFHTQAFIASV